MIVTGLSLAAAGTLIPTLAYDGTQHYGSAIVALLAKAIKPTSLTETIYYSYGRARQVLQYRSNGQYTSTRSYHDYGGRLIESIAPNPAVQKYAYNATGQQTWSRSEDDAAGYSRWNLDILGNP